MSLYNQTAVPKLPINITKIKKQIAASKLLQSIAHGLSKRTNLTSLYAYTSFRKFHGSM